MQVKKFEAPTIQEALDNVKRELGPEAIILQTKKNKRGFGLLSKGSVEITAAVSDRSLQKKQSLDVKLPEKSKSAVKRLSAEKQANIYDKYATQSILSENQIFDRVEVSQKGKKITATRYIDIRDEQLENKKNFQMKPQKSDLKPLVTQPTTFLGLDKEEKFLNKKSFEEEVQYLKKMIQDLKDTQESEKNSGPNLLQHTMLDVPTLQDVFEQLVTNGVERRYVLSFIKKVAFELGADGVKNPELVLDQLAQEIMDTIEVIPPFPIDFEKIQKPVMIALVGPTGVGKTSTIAKLASSALTKRGLKVGLINLDQSKLNSFEQLGTYAKLIKAPIRSASSEEDLESALLDFKNLDLIFFDTPGCSQKDTEAIRKLCQTLEGIPQIRIYMILAGVTKDIELYDAASRFSIFRPQGIIMSKLDEATIYGSIYNLSQRSKLPLVSFTLGQVIPDDIEDASQERLASLLLNI